MYTGCSDIPLSEPSPLCSRGSVQISVDTLLMFQNRISELENSGELQPNNVPNGSFLIECVKDGVRQYHHKNLDIIEDLLGLSAKFVGEVKKWSLAEFCEAVDEAKTKQEFYALGYYCTMMGREHPLVDLQFMVEYLAKARDHS